MGSVRCVISLGMRSSELFTAQMTHIFSHTACVLLLVCSSPEISAGVNEVTKESVQDETRKPKASPVGKVFTGSSAVFVHLFSFSSEGNERWICKKPLVRRENRASRQSLMAAEKCVSNTAVSQISARGHVPASSSHYGCRGSRLETRKLRENALSAQSRSVTDVSLDDTQRPSLTSPVTSEPPAPASALPGRGFVV